MSAASESLKPHRDGLLARSFIVSLLIHLLLLAGTAPPVSWMPGSPEPAKVILNGRIGRAGAPRPAEPVADSSRKPDAKAARRPAAPMLPPIVPKAAAPGAPGVSTRPEGAAVLRSADPEPERQPIAGPAGAPAANPVRRGDEGGTTAKSVVPESTRAAASGGGNVETAIPANEVRQYRTALAINARRFRRYPALAREQGWEGEVEIALDFRAALPTPEVSVARSSGKAVLDDQALEMIRQAVRVTDVPRSLARNAVRLSLPVEFRLDDDR